MEIFLFFVFLVGIVVALVQDVKRREVDNWLTVLLFVFGLVFIVFRSIYAYDIGILVQGLFAIAFGFVLMNLFYYGRVFGGGDAKLLFAMAVFFTGATWGATLFNLGIFILLLMFSGAVYGFLYTIIVYLMHFWKTNYEFGKVFKWSKYKYFFVVGAGLLLIGTWNSLFYMFGGLFLMFPFMLVFAKVLEKVAFVKVLRGNQLREGDWLVKDERVGKKIVKSNWDGLTKSDVKLLSKKKSVKVKDGIPFLPAFLIAFLLYYYFIDKIHWFVGLLF